MKKIFTTIAAILLFVAFSYSVWVGAIITLQKLIFSLNHLNQNQTTLLIATIPSTVSILGIVFSNYLQKSKEINFKNREKKEKAYDNLLRIFYEFINQQRTGKTNQQLMPLVLKSRKDLVLWGSDEVVKLFSEFMKIAQENPDDDPNKNPLSNAKFEQIILAIRKDLGYKNNKLILGDLIRFFT